jgi:O-antigen/teichoic acid export membrane protein
MIGRKSFLIVISKAISALLGFVGLYLITRYFPESVYGQIAYTMSLVALFASFADLGFATAYIKRVNEGKDPNDCLSSYLVVKLLLLAGVVTAIFITFWTWTYLLDRPLHDTDVQLIALFTLYYVFYHIAGVANSTFDANMKTAKTQMSLISEMLVRVPLIFFFAIPVGSVYALAWTYVIGGLVVAVVSLFLLSREGLRLKRPTMIRSMGVFALPLAVSVILGTIIVNIDKVSLGFFWNSTEVAIYAAGQSILTVLTVFGGALSTLLFPTLARLHENGERRPTQDMVQRGERYLSYIITPMVCVLMVFPMMIAMVLLGPKYTSSADVIQILCLNVLILSLGGIYMTEIVAMNRAKDLVWIGGVQLGLLLLFIVLFVPTSFFQIPMLGLGSVGTAMAVVLSSFIVVVVYRVVIWKMIGLGYNRAMSFHLIAALLSIGALLAIELVYEPMRWYDLILTWLVSAGVFYLALFLMRELKERDIRYFMDVLNPKEMWGYLKLEFGKKP